MNFFKNTVFLLLISFSIVCAEEFPKYRMVDLGIFETDQSQAIAINEKGQVLGTFEENGSSYLFLWEEQKGFLILDTPSKTYPWDLKLNNKGQIAGMSYSDLTTRMFYWDPNLGFWEMESSQNNLSIVGFNDKGQVLGQEGDQIFVWDHGKKTNLTKIFREQLDGNWDYFQPVCINNHGHVAFIAYNHQENGEQNWGTRSFLWMDGSCKMIMPEKDWETCINVVCIDDEGNMIAYAYPKNGVGGHHTYFISASKHIFSCVNCNLLRNGLPMAMDCLPGKFKKDSQGKGYYTAGIQIKKLFKDEYPYYNVANTADIRDQNSKGYVIGQIDTLFPGWSHAFLAIPESGSR